MLGHNQANVLLRFVHNRELWPMLSQFGKGLCYNEKNSANQKYTSMKEEAYGNGDLKN